MNNINKNEELFYFKYLRIFHVKFKNFMNINLVCQALRIPQKFYNVFLHINKRIKFETEKKNTFEESLQFA